MVNLTFLSISLFFSFAAFAGVGNSPPVFGVQTIKNEHLNSIRSAIIEDFVPRNFGGIVETDVGFLGGSTARFQQLHVDPTNFDSRDNALAATNGASDSFTLTDGTSTTYVKLAEVTILTTNAPVLLQLQSVDVATTPDDSPDVGMVCIQTCDIVFKRDSTTLVTLTVLRGVGPSPGIIDLIVVAPSSVYKIFDFPSAGSHVYEVGYLVSGSGNQNLDFRGNHQLVAVSL